MLIPLSLVISISKVFIFHGPTKTSLTIHRLVTEMKCHGQHFIMGRIWRLS